MDFEELIKEKVQVLKDTAEKKTPDFNPIYCESIEFKKRVSVHSEIGKFPEVLFKKRAPNQTKEEFEYIEANHKTITFPIWSRFIGVLNRIWSDQNWSIKWPAGSEETQQYFEKEIPKYENFESFFKNIITPLKQNDANAVLCVKPYDIPLKKTSEGDLLTDSEGRFLVDDTQKIRPFPAIYNSGQVISFESGEHGLFLTDEKVNVQYGNGNRKMGFVMEYYDRNNIYKIIQIGKYIDFTYKIIKYWSHNLGYLPSWKLKGVPLLKEGQILYQPHFMCAIESLDSALLDNSYLMAIKAGAAFPHKFEMVDECEFTNESGSCVDGKIYINGNMTTCPSCNGSGNKKPSILGVYQIRRPARQDGNTNVSAPFGWVAPAFEPMEFLRQEIELHKNEALSILNLQSSVTNAQGSDTALGKIIDREELFSFLLSISNQLFEIFEKSGNAIIDMREGKESDKPEVSYPKNFSIRNENDITAEIAQAKAAGAPDIAIRALLIEYMNVRFNTDSGTTEITDLAFIADKIITLSSIEIANKILSKTVAPWQDVLHTSLYSFISESVENDPNFFDKPMKEKVKILEDMAKAMLLQISPVVDSTQSILETSANSGK